MELFRARSVRARRQMAAGLVAVFMGIGLAAPASSFALYDFVVWNQWIADSWIPGPHARMLTEVQGRAVAAGSVCVNAVNAADNSWAGTTYCGYQTSHPYCGCVLRRGGGHAYPGTVVQAGITQHY